MKEPERDNESGGDLKVQERRVIWRMMRREDDYEGNQSIMQEKMKAEEEVVGQCDGRSHGEWTAGGESAPPNGMEAYVHASTPRKLGTDDEKEEIAQQLEHSRESTCMT